MALEHSDTRTCEMTRDGQRRAEQTPEATRLPASCSPPLLPCSQKSHFNPLPPPPQTMAFSDDGLDWGPGHCYVAGCISTRQKGHWVCWSPSNLVLINTCKEGIVPVFQVRKLRHSQVSDMVRKCQSWDRLCDSKAPLRISWSLSCFPSGEVVFLVPQV